MYYYKKKPVEKPITKMKESTRKRVLNHLMTRPISPIVSNSMEKDCDIALKIMCVIDYHMEIKYLYGEIEAVPKLLEQIFRFRYFRLFRYYAYNLRKSLVGNKLLQCECCEFIGPYKITLEHMVLNHNRHVSCINCRWCYQTELRTHETCNTLENCYMNYKAKQQISSNYHCPEIIEKCYNLISRIAYKLGVRIIRNEIYIGKDHQKTIDYIEISDDDDEEYDVGNHHKMTAESARFGPSKKTLNMDVLDKMFEEALSYFNISYKDDEENPYTYNNSMDQNSEFILEMPKSDHFIPNTQSPPHNYHSQQIQPTAQQIFEKMTMPRQISNTLIQTATQRGLQSVPYSVSQQNTQTILQPSSHSIEETQPSQMPNFAMTPPIQINDNLTPPIQVNGMNTMNNDLRRDYNEMATFTNFIVSTLNNMQSRTLRLKAKYEIQKLLLEISHEDLMIQTNDS